MTADNTRDKVIRMEAEIEAMGKQLSGMEKKVDEMHNLLMQARGAKWALGALAVGGGVLGAKVSTYLPFLRG